MQAPSMVQGKYPTAFPLKHQQKDMRLALEVASEGGLTLPVAAAANDMYVKVSRVASSGADLTPLTGSLFFTCRPALPPGVKQV